MTTQYILWISIEKCEVDGDDCYKIETVGEPRQAGCYRTEQSAYRHLESLLKQAHAIHDTRGRCSKRKP